MANRGGTPANLKPPWKPGKSANPKGRPSVDLTLKEMREEFGDWPREELMRMAKDKRLKPETRVRILQHLDDKFTGRARQAVSADYREPITAVEIHVVGRRPDMKTINGTADHSCPRRIVDPKY